MKKLMTKISDEVISDSIGHFKQDWSYINKKKKQYNALELVWSWLWGEKNY